MSANTNLVYILAIAVVVLVSFAAVVGVFQVLGAIDILALFPRPTATPGLAVTDPTKPPASGPSEPPVELTESATSEPVKLPTVEPTKLPAAAPTTTSLPFVSSYACEVSGDQQAGIPFTIRIKALDQDRKVMEAYDGWVWLSDTTGTISSIGTRLNRGVSERPVTITKASSSVVIQVNDNADRKGNSDPFKVSPGSPEQLGLTASPAEIFPDSRSFSILTASIFDHYGNLTDAQDIRFSTSLGSLDVGANPVSTTNGKAIASLKGSTGGGEAVVTVKAAGMQKEIRITIRSYAILILKKEVMTEATGQECGLPDNSEANCYRLQWTWDGVLRDQEYFDVRVWGPGEIKDDVNTCSVAAWPRLTGWERIQEQLAVEKQRQKGLYSYHLALPSNMNNTRPQLNYETVVQWTIAVVVNDTELGLVTVSESAPESLGIGFKLPRITPPPAATPAKKPNSAPSSSVAVGVGHFR